MRIWTEEQEEKLSKIRLRIREGYYFSHNVMETIAQRFLKEQERPSKNLTLSD